MVRQEQVAYRVTKITTHHAVRAQEHTMHQRISVISSDSLISINVALENELPKLVY